MNNSLEYFEYFKKYWYPVYKHQIFKAKFSNDTDTLIAIKENIYKNWHLEKYKEKIVKDLGIYKLTVREDLENGK